MYERLLDVLQLCKESWFLIVIIGVGCLALWGCWGQDFERDADYIDEIDQE